MSIIAIAGFPLAGKTTLAAKLGEELGRDTMSTDSLLGLDLSWSELSEFTAGWFETMDDVVIEGVAVPRALRKWLDTHDQGKPCEKVIWLESPKALLTDEQLAMGRGCRSVMKEIIDELEARGVVLQKGLHVFVPDEGDQS